ncbi:type II toxin-antitoxin system HipA family toxin [Streptomyces sp. NPDC058231]|uniref:type II toxin-antitoxin system HipA family toxin n=1 Tax=Streptomyces sp. NPDC058231 TaxID=3346392 RepID=UPI0036E57130
MAAQTTRARVLLGDRRVGTLHYVQGRSFFEYEDLEPDHPVFGLTFEYDPDVAAQAVTGVPSWFANLLPERESALRRIYNQQLGRREVPDFLLLVHLGQDLPGAVRVEAEAELPGEMSEALEEARTTASKQSPIGFSLSGMQLKFSMRHGGTGFTLPSAGDLGEWIVKLPSGRHTDLPANEYLVMSWARSIGIDVPEHHLIPLNSLSGLPEEYFEGGESAFAVRRFDRTSGGRVHQEDFAQVFNLVPADKDRGRQELIARVLLENCPEDFDEYLRRIVFCIAVGNNDEHLKNWSLRYADALTPRLSPAYDLLSVTSYAAFRKQGLTLSIDGQTDMRYISRDHFRRFAEGLEDHAVDPAHVLDVVDATVGEMRESLPTISQIEGAPDAVVTHLKERFNLLPLLR